MEHRFRLQEAIELHALECRINQLTEASIRSYAVRLKRFVSFAGNVELDSISPLLIKQYRLYLIEEKLSAQTQKGLLAALRAFFNYCVNDPDIPLSISPMQAQKMPRVPDKVLPSVKDRDFDKAVKACGNLRDKALLLLLSSSGIRAAEACAINIADANLKEGTIHIQIGKMQKGRIVYIDPATCKALRVYLASRKNLKPSHPLIASIYKNNARLKPNAIPHIMADIRKRTGVEYLTAHGLRRRFATKAVRSGMALNVTARLLGHADIDMLKQYLDLQDEDAADAYQRIFG